MHLPAKQDYRSLLPRNALRPPPPYFQHAFLDQLLREPSSSILCLCLCDPKMLDVRPTDPEQALSPAVGKRRHQPFKGHCDVTLDSRQPPKYPPRPPSSAFLPRPPPQAGSARPALTELTALLPAWVVIVHYGQGWRGERRALPLPLQDLLPLAGPTPQGLFLPGPCSADLPTLHPTPWIRSQDTLVSPMPDHAGRCVTPRAGQ